MTPHPAQARFKHDGRMGSGVRLRWANSSAAPTTTRCRLRSKAVPAWATALVSYTYSKCLDNGTYNIGTDIREANSNIPYYGVCQYNLANNFVFSYNYSIPIGRGKALLGDLPGWGNAILGNWAVSGITTAQSGLPFTPTISNDQANTGFGNQRPNLVGKVKMVKNVSCWFYISANKSCQSLAPGARLRSLSPHNTPRKWGPKYLARR